MRSVRALFLFALFGAVIAGITVIARGSPSPGQAVASGVVSVSAGSGHTCALLSGGVLDCWGANGSGQLGNADMCDPCPTPVPVQGMSSASTLGGGGGLSCAVGGDGGLACWGSNTTGQLGDGTFVDRSTPATVCADPACDAALTGVTEIDGGATHTCAVVAGGAKCWGNNRRAQLGRDEVCAVGCPYAGDVTGLTTGVVEIAAGTNHTCALLQSGGVRCWGDNDHGQLGDATLTRRAAPVDVCAGGAQSCDALLDGATAIAAGGDHTCALVAGGRVRCWGINGHASITSGRICSPDCTTPAEVCLAYTQAPDPPGCSQPLDGATALAAGSDFECVLKGGRVLCWGDHNLGQLGAGMRCATFVCTPPAEVCADPACAASLTGVTSIAAGGAHACAVASGAVKCWGRNSSSQLGHGVKPEPGCRCRFTPVDVAGLPSTPKTTPIATSTPSRTPVASSTSAPPLTPTPTPVATSTQRCGDANGDLVVNSVDALLILQYSAGFALPPYTTNIDVNLDGSVSSVDASLVLQYVAGRLPSLRCPAHP